MTKGTVWDHAWTMASNEDSHILSSFCRICWLLIIAVFYSVVMLILFAHFLFVILA